MGYPLVAEPHQCHKTCTVMFPNYLDASLSSWSLLPTDLVGWLAFDDLFD
jgi:hypothetical protein